MTNFEDLKKGVDVAVGTPGRLIDLAEQRALDLSAVSLPQYRASTRSFVADSICYSG